MTCDRGHVARRRQRVIHQRAAQQLPGGIVGDRFAEDAAQPLRGAAHDLSLDQHRVDDDAAIMGDDVFLDRDTAGLAIDLDDRGMDGIAPGDGRRLPVIGFLEPGRDPRRAAVVPARARRLRQPGEADRRAGYADDADAAIAQFEVGGSAFEDIGGDREDLLAQPLAGVVDRRRHGDRAAARHRAEAHRDRPPYRRARRRHPRARPSSDRRRSGRRSSPCPGPAGRRRTRHRSCRWGRCGRPRPRTARPRCPRYSSRCRARDSGPSRRASAWRRRNAATPPIAASALSRAPG